jgi:hypothetical protein
MATTCWRIFPRCLRLPRLCPDSAEMLQASGCRCRSPEHDLVESRESAPVLRAPLGVEERSRVAEATDLRDCITGGYSSWSMSVYNPKEV